MKAVWLGAGALALLLAACASEPDHFYVLAERPASSAAAPSSAAVPNSAGAPSGAAGAPTAAAPASPSGIIRLRTTLVPLFDRNELVLDGPAPGDAVFVLEHERWATNLGDQVARALARDLERRRPDLIVADGRFELPAAKPIVMTVSIVTLSARLGGRAALRARWRIENPAGGTDVLGSDTFETGLGGGEYAAVAQAYSELVGKLADRLVAALAAAP